jgi:hypothetical protein
MVTLFGDWAGTAKKGNHTCYIDGMTKQTEYEQAKERLDEIQELVDLFLLYKSQGDEVGIARVEKRVDALLVKRGLA